MYLEHRDVNFVPGAASCAEVDVALTRAAEALAGCDAWAITAGAGMGVDSGLPSFRGTTGLWKDKSLAMTYEDMSDDKWFFEDPAFAWGINYTQLEMYRHTEPHAGFQTLLRWTQSLGKPWYVFTSNIDCQFEKAGFEHRRVVTCHGDLHHLQCVDKACKAENKVDNVWPADGIPSGFKDLVDPASLRFTDEAVLEEPYFRCPRCGGLARPNVWFCKDRNHAFWEEESERRVAYNEWLKEIYQTKKRLVVIECGGGMDIPTVRCEGEDAVEEAGEGSLLVRMNPTDCRVPKDRAVGLPFGAREGLERLEAALEALRQPSAAAAGRSAGRRASPGPSSASASGARGRPAAKAVAGARKASVSPGPARKALASPGSAGRGGRH